MTEKTKTLQKILPTELNELISKMRSLECSSLALLGPGARLSPSSEDWPDRLKDYPCVFQLTEIVDSLAEKLLALSALTTLQLGGNQIGKAGVKHLAGLTNLTTLDLRNNEISDAGVKHLAGLTNLTTLDLRNNEISDAGVKHLAGLTNLTTLNLRNNEISDAGVKHLAGLTNLTRLDLRSNKIGEAGVKHLAGLTNLTALELGDNQVGKAGVKYLAGLTNLTTLELRNNQIGEAGVKYLAGLTNLTMLQLRSNQIGEAGVKHLAGLTNLTTLELGDNRIGDAGMKHLAGLGNLTTLQLWNNQIGEAGVKYLAGLTNLTTLELRSNQIGEAGVKHLAGLGNLTTLQLWNNQIGDAGLKYLAGLTNLTTLDLRNNEIGNAGLKHLAGLRNLTTLQLWNNQIGEAGVKHLAGLTNLTTLELRNNQIGDAGVKHLAGLRNLTTLELRNNQIGDAGVKHLAGLRNLTTLELGSTRIGDEGAKALGQLCNLNILNLNKAEVTDLSPFKLLFEKGIPARWEPESRWEEGIFVEGCPLIHPPPEVIKQGHEAVVNYFREIQSQGVDRLFEAKMLIVGEGRAGKTSLLRRLYQPDQPLPDEEETTKGIDIHRHDFQLANGRTFRLNVWDFGGQQIYHATHQFFLTKNSLYILLDDTAKNHKSLTDEGFRYWLEVIELLSARSPVLIFQNEKGGRSKAIDEAGIKSRFPNVKEVYRGNLDKPDSVKTLSAAIEFSVQRLPHVGEEVPAKWVSIRAALEEEATHRPYMSQEDYFSIYRRYLEFAPTKALHLSRYLHDLGVFLHFQDDRLLRRTVILQNPWATEAVFRILDDPTVVERLGRFTFTDCERVWATSEYANMHPELLALMEKFELCYALRDQNDTWLAPQLLSPSVHPALDGWAKVGDLVLSYRYGFLPKGLVSRLMVRMHRFVPRPEMAWVTGVLFEREETQVLVQITPRGNEIVLRARGPERQALLSVISSDLDALNAGFPGLEEKLSKWVPCICSKCVVSASPGMFEQKRLLKRKQDGRRFTIDCPADSYEDVSLLELLDGLKLENLPRWADKPSDDRNGEYDAFSPEQAPVKNIKIFLASSEELREDRDAFDLYFRQQNDRLRQHGAYLEIVRWENFLDAMSDSGLQDEYNREVRSCNIFVSLFKTKTGGYTEDEFDVAHRAFKEQGTPRIYTFFQDAQVSTVSGNRNDLQSLWKFQDKLSELGHFWTRYKNTADLHLQFRDQLDKLLDQGLV
ncbi:leucine-rich repeat domain-containing protein [Candidatus Nitrospira allomarina]|uniref:non-specific serine/threonine protein kinase n=1 Tax=Candidatus Nitrospira allomarina TaxID=3020900 RepID=A0AA96JXQ5_9BACT|nr:leucine-rich repeat domain-containing protein [Candidatus Nitrospira allomarina]WNM59311.1 leucine-rich repeat domain-containing protein [Candidatus Nitrospira allomarina]